MQVLIIKMLDQTTGRTQLQVQLATRGLITRAVGNTDLVVLTQDADVEAAMLRALCVLLEMKTTKQAANLDKLSAQVSTTVFALNPCVLVQSNLFEREGWVEV